MAPTTAPTTVPAATTAPVSSPAPTQAAAAPNAPSGKPSDLIVKALRALSTHSVRVTTAVADPVGTPPVVRSTFEFVPPDRMHVTLGNQETIIIKGQGTWIKQNGKWVKSPVDMSTSFFGLFDPNNVDELAAELAKTTTTTPPQFVGPDLLDGKPMFVYQYTSTTKGLGPNGSDIQSTSKLWTGALDNLPYKIESTRDSTGHPGQKVQTIVTYTYDPNLKIEAPQ
jgi:hypothetical protein